jgi:hypothetical protein
MLKVPKVGSIVQVTTRFPETYIYSKEKWRDIVHAGQIVPNDRWTPPGSFQMSTGKKEYPIATIALNRVIKIQSPSKTLTQSIKKTAPKVWKVKSKRSGEVYTVTNNSGSWSCTCVGFQYHRRCKHITEKKGNK